MSLTAPERETVITFNDEDDNALVHTHQRKVITKLRKNPAAKQTEDISHEGTAGAVFEIPADRVSFLGPKRKREMSEAQRGALLLAQQAKQAA